MSLSIKVIINPEIGESGIEGIISKLKLYDPRQASFNVYYLKPGKDIDEDIKDIRNISGVVDVSRHYG